MIVNAVFEGKEGWQLQSLYYTAVALAIRAGGFVSKSLRAAEDLAVAKQLSR